MSPFGLLVRHYRCERGLSQKDLAKHVGLSNKSYSSLETGRLHPDRQVMNRIIETMVLCGSDIQALEEAAVYSTNTLHIPFGSTPRAYVLAHKLIALLPSLTISQIDKINSILSSLSSDRNGSAGGR